MQSKASAKPSGTLEAQVKQLILAHDLGAVTLRAAAVGNGYFFAHALLRHGSARAAKRLREPVEAAGGSVLIKDIPAIVERIAEEPIELAKRAALRVKDERNAHIRAQNVFKPAVYVAPIPAPDDGRTPRVVDTRRVIGYRREAGSMAMVPIYVDEAG